MREGQTKRLSPRGARPTEVGTRGPKMALRLGEGQQGEDEEEHYPLTPRSFSAAGERVALTVVEPEGVQRSVPFPLSHTMAQCVALVREPSEAWGLCVNPTFTGYPTHFRQLPDFPFLPPSCAVLDVLPWLQVEGGYCPLYLKPLDSLIRHQPGALEPGQHVPSIQIKITFPAHFPVMSKVFSLQYSWTIQQCVLHVALNLQVAALPLVLFPPPFLTPPSPRCNPPPWTPVVCAFPNSGWGCLPSGQTRCHKLSLPLDVDEGPPTVCDPLAIGVDALVAVWTALDVMRDHSVPGWRRNSWGLLPIVVLWCPLTSLQVHRGYGVTAFWSSSPLARNLA